MSLSNFMVYEHNSRSFQNINLDFGQKEIFYKVSFRDEEIIKEATPYITKLEGNFPNPFNPSTTIEFGVRNAEFGYEHVNVTIYNIRGQAVKTLVNGYFGAGVHSVVWNGDDDNGRSVASGIYFYRLETSTGSEVRRMLLMK